MRSGAGLDVDEPANNAEDRLANMSRDTSCCAMGPSFRDAMYEKTIWERRDSEFPALNRRSRSPTQSYDNIVMVEMASNLTIHWLTIIAFFTCLDIEQPIDPRISIEPSHLCHHGNCVNPDHLVVETHSSNGSATSSTRLRPGQRRNARVRAYQSGGETVNGVRKPCRKGRVLKLDKGN